MIFDCKFDVSGGNPILKKKSLVKLIEKKETVYLWDIWWIRNTSVRRLHFDRTMSPVSLNEGFKDHKNEQSCFLLYQSLVNISSLELKDMPAQGRGCWKMVFSNSLTSNAQYVKQMEN